MRAIVIVAARMNLAGRRLPGKVMEPIAGQPMLALLLDRLRSCQATVVVATEDHPDSRPIVALCRDMDVLCHPVQERSDGPANDMMRARYNVAADLDADYILQADADDPLLDPIVVDRVLFRLVQGDVDYAKSAGWPLGMNAWGWTRRAMAEGHWLAVAADEREHVVPYWERRPDRYTMVVVQRPGEDLYGRYRLTVDTAADLELIRTIVAGVGPAASAERIIEYLDAHPEVAAINAAGLHGVAARDAIYDLTPVADPVVA